MIYDYIAGIEIAESMDEDDQLDITIGSEVRFLSREQAEMLADHIYRALKENQQ